MSIARKYLCALLLTACLAAWQACAENDGDIGDLFGRWQLTSIVTPDTTAHPADLFFSFQGQVAYVSVSNYALHTSDDLYGRYDHVGDSLILTILHDSVSMTPVIKARMADRFLMDSTTQQRLHIGQLDDERLVLDKGDRRWTLRKF